MSTVNIIEDYFSGYAAAVAQSRALIDVRDGLKPSMRKGLYANYTDKFVAPKKTAKFLKLIGSASRFCWHGDASTYGMLIRAAKPFAMRYPLYDTQGSYGTLMSSDSHAAPRYVEGRINALGKTLFSMLEKDVIRTWVDNYDNTEQAPSVLPSIGFWNVCNGSSGIGCGLASSIPQFNLREMNEALVKMLNGQEFDIPMPDFATGAFLLNPTEVKKALFEGKGASCKLRAKILYDKAKNTLCVRELPYATYTDTICKELEELINSEENPGIDSFNDATGVTPDIEIYLKKGTNPNEVLNMLYSKTSLQNNYGINLVMLKDGKYPETFTLPQAMQEYLNHTLLMLRRSFEYDKSELEEKIEIHKGYIKACAQIEEVIHIIKNSADKNEATLNLIKFGFTTLQAKAILKMTLGKIASLESKKFEIELVDFENDLEHILAILNSEELLKQELVTALNATALAYGDARRTVLVEQNEEQNIRGVYFFKDGRARLTLPQDTTPLTTLPKTAGYIAISKSGYVFRFNEEIKRGRKVFDLLDGDCLIGVEVDPGEGYINFIDAQGTLRARKIETLSQGRTRLPLSNIKSFLLSVTELAKDEYHKCYIAKHKN